MELVCFVLLKSVFSQFISPPPFWVYYIIIGGICKVKYSACAECEIMCCRTFWNIAPCSRNVKWNLPTFASANISHLRSKYFTAKLFHLPEGQILLKKRASLTTCSFFWGVLTKKMPPWKWLKSLYYKDFQDFCNYFTAVLTVGGVILQNQSFYEKDDVGHLSFYEKDALVIF